MTGNLKVLLNYQKATPCFHVIEFGFLIIDSMCAWIQFQFQAWMHTCSRFRRSRRHANWANWL